MVPTAVTYSGTGLTTTQSVVYAPTCHINLLGHDAMFDLDIGLGPHEGGRTSPSEICQMPFMMNQKKTIPFYYYSD